jgi:twitching motility protein PilT
MEASEMRMEQIVARAIEEHSGQVSDVFLRAGHHPILRTDGNLHETDWGLLDARAIEEMCELLLNDGTRLTLRQRKDVSLSLTLGSAGPVRVAILTTRDGLSVVVRLLPRRCPTLEELGYPPEFADLTRLPNGLVLVTGRTGCGKSTTLWAMIEHINAERCCHIVSLQSPLEMVIEDKRSLITLREIVSDSPSHAEALRATLLHDPDVVHIGEIPDLETLTLALVLAETGHLVLSQIHTASAAETVERLVSVFPADDREQARKQLACVLRAVVAQGLVRRADGKGRVPVIEVMIVIPEIAELIAAGRYEELDGAIAAHAGEGGMRTMAQTIAEYTERGIIAG